MKGTKCEVVSDLLPDWANGSIPPAERDMVEAHLQSCADCRGELELVRSIRSERPMAPPGLEARIQARIRDGYLGVPAKSSGRVSSGAGFVRSIFSGRRWLPVGALSAAAMLILALGTSLIWGPKNPDVIQDPIVVAAQEPLPEAWLWDDGMIAGAPVFDGFSDEELEALLKELEG